jgi:protein involved in polysaccharide export with SLBB domain
MNNGLNETDMTKKIFFSFFIFLYTLQPLCAQNLDPGDGVRLTFFNISEQISGDYYLQQNHILQLPYAGLFKLEGKNYSAIKDQIIAKYDSLYRGVELIVTPLYKINVLGEVRTPGVYYVTGVEKLLDVIAMAGGETEDSDMSEILVQRKDGTLDFDAEDIINGDNDSEDFYLKSGDRIYVTRKWWVSAQNTTFLFTAASLVVAIYAVMTR